jgi:hypothetical protein
MVRSGEEELMRSSRNNRLLRGLAVMAVAALLLAGCNESSPTEPKALAVATPIPTLTPTPLPPGGNAAGTWTGTYVSTDRLECDSSIVFPAQATLTQNGSDVRGTLTATGDSKGCPCGKVTFTGTLKGNALEGMVGSPKYPWRVYGTFSGSALDVALVNSFGTDFGQMRLHR